jgi:Family of unknown function (DUF6263)
VVVGLLATGASGAAQTVKLEIRPRMGDTLHLRYDQRTEATDGPTGTVVSTLLVMSRTIVVGSDKRGTDVVAVTDSVDMAPQSAEPARELLEGRPLHLRVDPDGATKLAAVDTGTVEPQLRATLAQMPAMLPRKAVKVGRTWRCDVQLPLPPGRGGKLKATFRLDSLSRSGDLAYVSLRGMLRRDGPSGAASTGVVTGTLLVDRRRGWLTDSRATIHVTSPTVQMTITEWLRTTDR